jgi:hypothetical protein
MLAHEANGAGADATAVRSGPAIPAESFFDVVRTMALRHQKWDAQVGDVAALAPFPLVLTRATWQRMSSDASALACETEAVERELVRRPDLHARLGLPVPLAFALRSSAHELLPPAAGRIMRFDFHHTDQGWRISEVNSDVPGGFTESSRFTELVAERSGAGEMTGDAAAAWVEALATAIPTGSAVALLSAAGWVEDIQVVAHLAARLRAFTFEAHLASPHQLHWKDGRAHLAGTVGLPRGFEQRVVATQVGCFDGVRTQRGGDLNESAGARRGGVTRDPSARAARIRVATRVRPWRSARSSQGARRRAASSSSGA